MERQSTEKGIPTSIKLTKGERLYLSKLTAEINALADVPRRISRGHVIRAIIAMSRTVRPERILKNLQF